jgi:pimeloyl-ACP methyl ester carboxylesterase
LSVSIGISVPVLVIYGDDDPYGLPLAESTIQALPEDIVRVVVLPGCGHYWQEQEEDFVRAAHEFLNRGSE